MLPAHWEGWARATLNKPASRAKNLGSREGGAEGGFKGGFRAARAVRFRQGSLGSGFALFPKLTTFLENASFPPRGFAPRRGLSPNRVDFSAGGGEERFINCRCRKPFC